MENGRDGERPLRAMAQAFMRLASGIEADGGAGGRVGVAQFAQACSLVSVLFGSLGVAFKFAEKDYTEKVHGLIEASKSFDTLDAALEFDVQNNRVRRGGSPSRNLLRVKRGIEMVKILFDHILESENVQLRVCAAKAYEAVFAQHHPWAIRKAVGLGTYTLPSKAQLVKSLNEDEASARVQMSEYVRGVTPILAYIDNLFLSRRLGVDW